MPKLDTRELATILAALRYWQRTVLPNEVIGDRFDIFEQDIADNAGQCVPLTIEEIDALCGKLNPATRLTSS